MLKSKEIPHSELDPVWAGVFAQDDRVLWVGRPDHGRKFREFEGHELIYYCSMLIGGAIIWPVGLSTDHYSIENAILAYAVLFFVTAGGFAVFYYMASSRAYVMSNLFYAVTDKSAYIVRRGGNFRMSSRRYVLSFPFVERYAFLILEGRKYGSVQVGSLLANDTVQPFGLGLAHPGWPILRNKGVIPALFESIKEAGEMQQLLQQLTDDLQR